MKCYVTMTDKFMSGWGCSDGKINKLVFVCDTVEEAEIVEQNARLRTDMKQIRFCIHKPRYDSDRYYVQIKTKNEYSSWYKKGYFLR